MYGVYSHFQFGRVGNVPARKLQKRPRNKAFDSVTRTIGGVYLSAYLLCGRKRHFIPCSVYVKSARLIGSDAHIIYRAVRLHVVFDSLMFALFAVTHGTYIHFETAVSPGASVGVDPDVGTRFLYLSADKNTLFTDERSKLYLCALRGIRFVFGGQPTHIFPLFFVKFAVDIHPFITVGSYNVGAVVEDVRIRVGDYIDFLARATRKRNGKR